MSLVPKAEPIFSTAVSSRDKRDKNWSHNSELYYLMLMYRLKRVSRNKIKPSYIKKVKEYNNEVRRDVINNILTFHMPEYSMRIPYPI